MSPFSAEQLRLISTLLHDATLQEVAWDPSCATFTARFNCLRRNLDGSDLEDRVELSGLAGIAVGYDSTNFEQRPSEFHLPRLIQLNDLLHWPFRPQEAMLWINCENEEALESARVEWLMGDAGALQGSKFTFCLTFDSWCDFGMPPIHLHLLVAGDSFTISSGGHPLALERWEKEFEAWWQGWKEHWDQKNEPDDAHEYDTFMPLAADEPADPGYQPPREQPFLLEPNYAPPEIILPIRDWFGAQHRDRAAWLKSNRDPDYGQWSYARSIDRWWVEGIRACVVVRGIEHTMASEDDPAENRESVWTFALRQRAGNWTIHNRSQGWPGFGSARKVPVKQKPWLKHWNSGEVK